MVRQFAILAALGVALAAASAEGPKVKVGSRPPSLASTKVLKGQRPNLYDGRVHVVEFWATWCPPCVESISHLSRVARENHGKVDVVGVGIWELAHGNATKATYLDTAKQFVRQQGDNMGYNVLEDGPEEPIAKAWMAAADQHYIPTSFIVNRRGRIAWIGSPFVLDTALKAVLSESGNPATTVKQDLTQEKADTALIESAADRGDLATVLSIHKRLSDRVSLDRVLRKLAKMNPADAIRFAHDMMSDPKCDMWQMLEMSWGISGPDSDWADVPTLMGGLGIELAQAGMRKADPSEESRLTCLDYLARAYAHAHDMPNAVKTEETAIRIMRQSHERDHASGLVQAQKQLVLYQNGKSD